MSQLIIKGFTSINHKKENYLKITIPTIAHKKLICDFNSMYYCNNDKQAYQSIMRCLEEISKAYKLIFSETIGTKEITLFFYYVNQEMVLSVTPFDEIKSKAFKQLIQAKFEDNSMLKLTPMEIFNLF